jgi:cytochrome c oxidase subunit IV
VEHTTVEHTSPPLRIYFIVYAALIILLVLTVAAARIELGGWGAVVAMAIASIKAILVLLYFMHLRYSSRLTWLFASAGFIWLLIIFLYVLSDYFSRGWVGSYP